MEDNTADELDVVVDHVPGDHVAASHPVVEVDGFVVAVAAGDDVDVVASDGEFAVVVGGGYDDFGVLGEAAGGFLDHAEGFGEDVVEDFLGFLVRVFFELVDLFVDAFFFVDGHVVLFLDAEAEGGELLFFFFYFFTDAFFEFEGLGAQLVVVEFLDFGICFKGCVEEGFYFFEVAVGFCAK